MINQRFTGTDSQIWNLMSEARNPHTPLFDQDVKSRLKVLASLLAPAMRVNAIWAIRAQTQQKFSTFP